MNKPIPEDFDRAAFVQYLVDEMEDWDRTDLLEYAQDARMDDLSALGDDDLWLNYSYKYADMLNEEE